VASTLQQLSGYSIKARAKRAVRLESATTPRTAVKQCFTRKSFWTGEDGIATSKYICTFKQPGVCQIEVRESLKLGAVGIQMLLGAPSAAAVDDFNEDSYCDRYTVASVSAISVKADFRSLAFSAVNA
jgi:hypothetical protein